VNGRPKVGPAVLALALLASACAPGVATNDGATEPTLAAASPSTSPTAKPTPIALPTASPVPTPSATPEVNWDEEPTAPHDQAPLAAQLLMVEAAIRDPSVTGAKLVWMGHLQQLIYSRLRDYPEWRDAVVGVLPADQQAAVRGTLDAGKEMRKLRGAIPRTLPNWRILEPAAPEVLMSFYREAEAEFGVPWQYLAAINLVETRMGRIHGLSSAGAQGPMQFMPATWAAYGKGDVHDPRDAILGAARYLRASGAPGNMAKALWAYNHHEGYVNGVTMYADVMKKDPNAYRGYYGWQVYYTTVEGGTVVLPVGWTKP
jgi:soluble lytic murein transglycosylase-like protein